MRGATAVLHGILQKLAQDRALAGAAPGAGEDEDIAGAKAKLGDIVDRLDERAFGFLLFFLALPCCLPFVYVLPQIVALPMIALVAQLAAGRKHPWLPKVLHEREFSVHAFQTVIRRAEKYVGWVERFAQPRLRPVTTHLGGRFIGALLLIPAVSILVPLPSTNTVPGIGVAVASLGIIERDGVLVIVGLLIGLVWVTLLLFLGLEAASLIRAQFEARF